MLNHTTASDHIMAGNQIMASNHTLASNQIMVSNHIMASNHTMVFNNLVHIKIGQMHFKIKVDFIVLNLGPNHLDHQVELPHLDPHQNLRLPHLEPLQNLRLHHLVPLLLLQVITREKLRKKHQIWPK